MKFTARRTTNQFTIHLADSQAAKPGEEPGTREGEPIVTATGVDEDGDRKTVDFYSSDALNQSEVEKLKQLLEKLSSHAVATLR